jgi:hypothetical protein
MSDECRELLFSLKGAQLLTFINCEGCDNDDYYEKDIPDLYIHMLRTNSDDLKIFIEDCPHEYSLKILFQDGLYTQYNFSITDIISDIFYRIEHNIPSIKLFNECLGYCLKECNNEEQFTIALIFCKYFMQFGAYKEGLNALELYEPKDRDEGDYRKGTLKNKLYI